MCTPIFTIIIIYFFYVLQNKFGILYHNVYRRETAAEGSRRRNYFRRLFLARSYFSRKLFRRLYEYIIAVTVYRMSRKSRITRVVSAWKTNRYDVFERGFFTVRFFFSSFLIKNLYAFRFFFFLIFQGNLLLRLGRLSFLFSFFLLKNRFENYDRQNDRTILKTWVQPPDTSIFFPKITFLYIPIEKNPVDCGATIRQILSLDT